MSVLALDLETPRVSAVSWAVTNGLSTLIACAIDFTTNPRVCRKKKLFTKKGRVELEGYSELTGVTSACRLSDFRQANTDCLRG